MVLDTIVCHHGGDVGHSKFPYVHTAFKRARIRFGRDLGEGGAELKCAYLVRIKDCQFEKAVKISKEILSEEEMNKVLL